MIRAMSWKTAPLWMTAGLWLGMAWWIALPAVFLIFQDYLLHYIGFLFAIVILLCIGENNATARGEGYDDDPESLPDLPEALKRGWRYFQKKGIG